MADLPLPEVGDAWLNNDTKKLKYRLDTKNYTVVPQGWFTAGETFDKPGYVVSLKSDGRIYKTDSATLQETIGLNLNVANVGNPIEIQFYGLYHYTDTDYPTDPFQLSDIGKIAYVKASPDGTMITDRTQAVINNNNVIEVGIVTSTRDIVISVQGDARGPLEYNEFEYVAGEAIDASGVPVLVSVRDDGKVYKASKDRSQDRERAIGFIVGATTSLNSIVDGTRVIIRKTGLVTGFSGLIVGRPVFAGGTNDSASFGTILQNQDAISPYYDSFIHIGYAYSTTGIVCNIQPPYFKYDDVPIGGIILADSSKTVPDSGYLFCDGATCNAVTNPEYQDLYDVIKNTWGGTDNTNFVLPNLNGAHKYQIKYKNFYQKQPTNAPVLWYEYPSVTSWATYPGNNSSFDIDVSAFGSPFNPDDFKDVQIKVYAKNGSTVVQIPDPYVYNPGTGNKYYGYTVTYKDTTHITFKINHDGLAYVVDNINTVLDATWSIKVICVKNERFNRYRDVNADYTIDMLLNWINLSYPQGYLEAHGNTSLLGNMAIGTNDPAGYKLRVYGGKVAIEPNTGAIDLLQIIGTTDSGIQLKSGTTSKGYFWWDNTNSILGIGPGNTSDSLFFKNGNTAIGTNDPSGYKLRIFGGKVAIEPNTGAIDLLQIIGTTDSGIQLKSGTTSKGYFWWDNTNSILGIGPGGGTDSLYFKSGNTAIGTNDPSGYKLRVFGGKVAIESNSSVTDLLQVIGTGDTGVQLKTGTTSKGFFWWDNSSNFLGIGPGQEVNSLFFNNGNLSIGTTNPSGYKLRVNGTVRVEQSICSGGYDSNGNNPNNNPGLFMDSAGSIKANQLFLQNSKVQDTSVNISNSLGPSSVPLGAGIIEVGENSNGKWTKWSDGTMLCEGLQSVPTATTTNNINFPESFSTTNDMIIKYSAYNQYPSNEEIELVTAVESYTVSSFNLRMNRVSGSNNNNDETYRLFFSVTGRWE
jgi:hypothetical protein